MIKMKETMKLLIQSYIGECQARNRYTFYASVAKKEGFQQIMEIFNETATQEKVHAKNMLRMIHQIMEDTGEKLDVIQSETAVPLVYSNTLDNLKAAVAGENHEYTKMYPHIADVAEKEGYKNIAIKMRAICSAEEHHEGRYKKILEQIENSTFFEKDKEVVWICRECGYMHKGKKAPKKCPSCDHPTDYFQVQCENY